MSKKQQLGHMFFKDEKFHFVLGHKTYSWNYLESLYDKDTKVDVKQSQPKVSEKEK